MTLPAGATVNTLLAALPQQRIHINGDEINWQDFQNFIQHITSTTPSYQEGIFTGTLTGVTGTHTAPYTYIKISNLVTIIPSVSLVGASNSTAATITGMPSIIWPQIGRIASVVFVESSNAIEQGTVSIGTNGIITLFRANGTSTFVNDGLNKGLGTTVFSYTLTS